MDTDPNILASTIMQATGTLYAIFIAITILGIQTCLTILNINNTMFNFDSIENFSDTVGKFQTVHRVLAYSVIFIEFACGFYIYNKIIPGSPGLLFLYGFFMVAVLFIVLIFFHLIDFLLTPITGKPVKLNFKKMETLARYDLLTMAAGLFCIFFHISHTSLVPGYHSHCDFFCIYVYSLLWHNTKRTAANVRPDLTEP